MKAVGHEHIASEWRLFIDSNKSSLKGILLHNGNEFPSIHVAYASHLRVLRSYENAFSENKLPRTLLVNLFRL